MACSYLCTRFQTALPYDLLKDSPYRANAKYRKLLKYSCCIHQNKYRFKSKSPLKAYLRTKCKGFVKDPLNEYTINYLIIVLFANWSEYKLLKSKQIRATLFVKTALQVTDEYVEIRDLRRLIKNQLQAALEEPLDGLYYYDMPIWCPEPETVQQLRNFFGQTFRARRLYISLCHKCRTY